MSAGINEFMSNSTSVPEPSEVLLQRAGDVKRSAIDLAQTSDSQRKRALFSMADSLENHSEDILLANSHDLKQASTSGLAQALLSRLKLDQEKLAMAIKGVKQVAELSDPIGLRQMYKELDEGLFLERITVPLGVIGVIFESRPDAVMQIASLAIRSGNAAILKGGSEANKTNMAIINALEEGLSNSGFPKSSLCLLTTRAESLALLKLEKYVDLIIPRGSNELVRFIQDNTRIPVLGHADGICHLYIDSQADLEMALAIVIDSKCQYPAACNAIETLLLHESIASKFLMNAIQPLETIGVDLLGDEVCQQLGVKGIAKDEDWSTEYLDLSLSLKVVSDMDEALDHIRQYGSRHTDGIVTEDSSTANRFLSSIDSSGVYHNCSTRFADGFRYGFGAEVGISTQTLPPRGPVGLEGLVTYRYFLRGNGHIAADYVSGKRVFSHKSLKP